MAQTSKYKRVVLKLSGEALAGEDGFGINPIIIKSVVNKWQKLLRWIAKLQSSLVAAIFGEVRQVVTSVWIVVRGLYGYVSYCNECISITRQFRATRM